MAIERKKNEKQDEKEECVLCHEPTEYSYDTPIGERQFYIEGCGQVCEKCFKEYIRKN